jgi:hypothetical protein
MYYIAMAGVTLKAASQRDAMVLAQNPNQQDVDDAELPAMPPCNLYSDDPPLESYLHLQQLLLLLKCLDWRWQARDDYFAAGNLTIYDSSQKIKTRDFKGPDFFVVLGTKKRLGVHDRQLRYFSSAGELMPTQRKPPEPPSKKPPTPSTGSMLWRPNCGNWGSTPIRWPRGELGFSTLALSISPDLLTAAQHFFRFCSGVSLHLALESSDNF